MRYATDHKEQTRQRIIEIAARLYKEHGIHAVGLAAVMKQANLTNGAFYAHFNSKDALVDAVVQYELKNQLHVFEKTPDDIDGLKQIIAMYLSKEHRDSCESGCPSAALLGEITKRNDTTKKIYGDGLNAIADSLASKLGGSDTAMKSQLIFAIIGLLVGTLQLSRAVEDSALSDEFLEGGKKAAFSLLATQ